MLAIPGASIVFYQLNVVVGVSGYLVVAQSVAGGIVQPLRSTRPGVISHGELARILTIQIVQLCR